MTKHIVIFAALLMGACVTKPLTPPEPIVRTVEVKIATPVPCAALAKLGADPAYADSDGALAATTDVFESTRLLLMGRLQRIKRLAEYGAARVACQF